MSLTDNVHKCAIAIILFLVLSISISAISLHIINREQKLASDLAEHNAILRMNNKILTETDTLYQKCETLRKEVGYPEDYCELSDSN